MDIQVSRLSCACRPLPGDLRRLLERCWGADLSVARVHVGPDVDAVLRIWGLAGAATGTDILVASAFPEGGTAWRGIVAHEAAHVVQQARGAADAAGALDARASQAVLEAAAEAAATAALDGRRFADILAVRPKRLPVVQGFNAWEHQLLGDLRCDELVAIAARSGSWQTTVRQMLAVLELWQANPATVTVAAIHDAKPNLAVVQLANSQCLATRGELNAISADYVADPVALNQLPVEVVLPFLQQVRQETFNRLGALIGSRTATRFPSSITAYSDPDLPAALWEAQAAREAQEIDAFTIQRGLGINHFYGLLARNACHFAPFGWHRWRIFHEHARSLAARAHAAPAPAEQGPLIAQAWSEQCYADHFLQDVFAAGHLINKTLIMQWFIEWLHNSLTVIPLPEWQAAASVTVAHQPNLWGPDLYDLRATAQSNDPQTAEEESTYSARLAASAVQAYDHVTAREAYRQYIDFLGAGVIQLSSKWVHDHFNETSLTVTSHAASAPYRIYGDETLLRSPTAVQQVSLAVQASQRAVAEILQTGSTSIDVKQVLDMLPTQVQQLDGTQMSLKDWHAATGPLWTYCRDNIFAEHKAAIVGALSAHMGTVSVDQARR